jgi:hypothetical protein
MTTPAEHAPQAKPSDEFWSRIAELRTERAAARAAFEAAGVELEKLQAEGDAMDAEHGDWKTEFEQARDEGLIAKGRTLALLDILNMRTR